MKRIAIFVSGAGEAAERVVKLFNEGNRVKTALVVVDDSAVDLLEKIKNADVTSLHITDEEWPNCSSEVVELIKDNEVKLIVLDDFAHAVSDEIMEAVDGEVIKVTSPEQAPREVVAALEADLRKPVEEAIPEPETEEETTPTPESEWADALKIHFTPPKVPTTPPEVPREEAPQDAPQYGTYYNQDNYRPFNQENYRPRNERHMPEEPMPSTWLIWSVLATVFCCFIPGIIAIIFSSQVSSRYYNGDVEGARRASRNAEIWIIVSVVLGVLAATLYLPFMIIGS